MGNSSRSVLIVVALLALAALVATGCHAVVSLDEDAGTDTNTGTDTDSESDTHSDTWIDTDWGYEFWDWSCTDAGAEPCADHWDFPYLYEQAIDAEEHGVVFIHASHSPEAILAELEVDGDLEPVVMVHFDGLATYGLLDPPAEPLRAIDIASGYYLDFNDVASLLANELMFGYAAIALLCGVSSCALYGLALDEDGVPLGLEPVPGGDVPLPAANAVAATGSDDQVLLCAAGDGIACFDGTDWTLEVAPGGPVLRDLYAGAGFLVAAGDEGRVVTDRGGGWHEIDLGTSMDLVSVTAGEGLIAAVGSDGYAFGDGAHAIACDGAGAFSAAFWRGQLASTEEDVGLTVLSFDSVLELWAVDGDLRSCGRAAEFAGAPTDAGYLLGCTGVVCGYALTTGGLYVRAECVTFE